jgi:hypothetical protein
MRNDLQRKLDSIQKRIDKMRLMSDFLKRNPQIAARSTVKYLSGAYVGLVVDDKALIRPQGLNSDALRLERWLEDGWDEVELEDRILSKDISGLSSDELDAMLTEIPSPNGDDASEDGEDD